MDLEAYKLHTRNVEAFLESEVINFKKASEEAVANFTAADKAEYFEYLSTDYLNPSQTYPTIQRTSKLLSIFSVFEGMLNRICIAYEKSLDNPVKIKDLQANSKTEQLKIYLEKVARIDFPSANSSWKEIQKIQQIRKIYLYDSGIVDGNDLYLIEYIKNSPYLNINMQNRIEIKKGLSEYCLGLFEAFFDELFLKIRASLK